MLALMEFLPTDQFTVYFSHLMGLDDEACEEEC